MTMQASTIAKGRLLRATDDYLAQPPAGKTLKQFYQDRLAELQSASALSDLAVANNVMAQTDKPHADNDFLGNAWWPAKQDKEKILREAFIKAYKEATKGTDAKPIELFWVVAGDSFEGVVVDGDRQVSIFVLTPKPPSATMTGLVDDRMWLVAPSARVDQVKQLYSDPSAVKIETPGPGDIRILQYRSD
jgi:hypothetical protein